MTVEDPIEFLHQHKRAIVNQREVGEDTHSFANALKHVLRQDPDVILVGEMRDLETISTALTAAETGHLVFATLHTQDAPQSIDRIIDVFPAHQQQQVRVQLAASLQGICTQQLLPTRRRPRPRRRVRGARRDARDPQPHPRRRRRTRSTRCSRPAGSYGMVTMDMSLAQLVRSAPDLARHRARALRERRRPAPPHGRLTMPETYAYKVRDRSGKLVEGTLEADNAAARDRQAALDGLRAHRDPAAGRSDDASARAARSRSSRTASSSRTSRCSRGSSRR